MIRACENIVPELSYCEQGCRMCREIGGPSPAYRMVFRVVEEAERVQIQDKGEWKVTSGCPSFSECGRAFQGLLSVEHS